MSILGKFAASPKKRSELPKDYADQILKNDITLMMSKYTDSIALNNLIQLYMKGVEYYEAQKDQQSEYFKSKLNWLMSHPSIISPKKKEEQTLPKQSIKKLDFKVHSIIDTQQHYDNNIQQFEIPQEKQEVQKNNLITIQTNEVKQMIDNLKKETTKINEVISQLHQIIQNDLNSQKNKIADRIHKRSKSFVNKNKFEQEECIE
ncbi:unnamed protein product [Paramecium primaurelia]|uniref:Uncharacterized protein n=2 Tax=Paramecium TaxID=5884 RepID=A0A8S1X704_9CILI|nr:unnamed protein product [Paramecium primaurelia]CAD8197217.1 unnamed protein product [Paramecium pentaurelia]